MDSTDILQKCTLFKNLSGDSLAEALAFFHAQEKHYKKGAFLHRPGEPLGNFGLLLSGSVQVYMNDFDGNMLIMASVSPGSTFAESLCYLKRNPAVYIRCMADSDILVMDTRSLSEFHPDMSPVGCDMMRRFTQMLAERTLNLNSRIQTLSKLSIREKVITLLSEYVTSEKSSTVSLPFNREGMAAYLGVNQSALSRELSRMQQEGIIRFQGNQFEILP